MQDNKKWVWQDKNWPNFIYDPSKLAELEENFLVSSGRLLGLRETENDSAQIIISLSEEALTSSAIEGEFLNRDSVQSSLRSKLGFPSDARRVPVAEEGVAELFADLYKHHNKELTQSDLFRWHSMLLKGQRDIEVIGAYRSHSKPMQIISGRVDEPKIHYEAPPSARVAAEMDAFLEWNKHTGTRSKGKMSALMRAGLTHLYFVLIHPFEDGNGRLARLLALKSLSESLDRFCLIALSETILRERRQYYKMLELNNKYLDIQSWLEYFASTILRAQSRSIDTALFLVEKTRFFDQFRDTLNSRQEKMIVRVFREGIDGFEGGISAEKYIHVTNASRATATRDLVELVELGALIRTGTGKGTRYWLRKK